MLLARKLTSKPESNTKLPTGVGNEESAAVERVSRKRPQAMTHFLKDNTGQIIGVEVLYTMTDSNTGFVEYKTKTFSMDELEKIG